MFVKIWERTTIKPSRLFEGCPRQVFESESLLLEEDSDNLVEFDSQNAPESIQSSKEFNSIQFNAFNFTMSDVQVLGLVPGQDNFHKHRLQKLLPQSSFEL